jgi:hypothetical protein
MTANAVGEQDHSQAHGEMADDEQDGERIMRDQPDIPRIEQQTGRRARGPRESRVDAQEYSSENEDRDQVGDDVRDQISAGRGLNGRIEVSFARNLGPDQAQSTQQLEYE